MNSGFCITPARGILFGPPPLVPLRHPPHLCPPPWYPCGTPLTKDCSFEALELRKREVEEN
eukprot:3046836-Rhodomonas_salina.1